MKLLWFILLLSLTTIIISCSASKKIEREIAQKSIVFNEKSEVYPVDLFLNNLAELPLNEREDSLVKYILNGGSPKFNLDFKSFISIYYWLQKALDVSFWVSPDYISIGTNKNFVRMPLTPQSAQFLADKFNSILPTTKMVDEIYKAATVKLPPLPMIKHRDSFSTFIKHNLLIQEQLKNKIANGIVAGIKKDIVQSVAVLNSKKSNRVAIYGWHKLDGNPIQPLYTGHVDWYVDYSHGVRLVYKKMAINNKVFLVNEVLGNPELAGSICKEVNCKLMRY